MTRIPKPLTSCVCWLLDWLVKKLTRSILKKTAAGKIDSRQYSWRVECFVCIRKLQFAMQVRLETATAFPDSRPSSEKGLGRARDDPEVTKREK